MLHEMDGRRLGLVIRALRRRRGWRQLDLARAATVSQSTVSAVERGHLDTLSLRTIKAVVAALDGRLVHEVRWRGGHIERLMDEGHASLASEVVGILADRGWQVRVEVSYSHFGERGAIDILAWHATSRTLLVVELKTELTSIESTLRKLDEKERLATSVARERFGWRPVAVGVMLIVREGPTDRARARRAEVLLAAALPSRSVAARAWLRQPSGGIRGLWFLSPTDRGGSKRRTGGPDRVRRPGRTAVERGNSRRPARSEPRLGRPFV
ncbi:hypothetical protein BH20CHL5_BH20CHL5_08710 [soil metagenome]|jgi:transcriptional regulator with XRE-family HTH domain|nr:helix-turn-helix domain-containing protein [Chloroflexota bacterium]